MWVRIKSKDKVAEHQETEEAADERRKRHLEKIKHAYEPGPHQDRTAREQDFERLSKELQRQFELLLQFDTSVDTKSGIILGFIMLIIAQIALNLGFIDTITSHALSTTALFLAGFAFVLLSFAVGMLGFWIHKYELGPDVYHNMFPLWWNKEEKYYSMNIFSKVANAYDKNELIRQKKVKHLRGMLSLFMIGLVLILASTALLKVA
jgi:hypothetical protein